MTGKKLVAVGAVIAALGLTLIPGVSASVAAKRPVISIRATSLGPVLVDSRGRTLYLFKKDKHHKSACYGQCATFWPPLIASRKPVAGRGAKASLLGTTRRKDGRMQVTYNHHPLYRLTEDTKRGQTNGEGVSAFGAKWFAVSPSGAAIVQTPAGGGY